MLTIDARLALAYGIACLVVLLFAYGPATLGQASLKKLPSSKAISNTTTIPAGMYLLKVVKNDGPCGCSNSTVSPAGGSLHSYGSAINISETPGQGYHFITWICTGYGCYSGPNRTADIIVHANITEMAIFYVNSGLAGGAGGGGNGSVGGGGGGNGTGGGYGGGET
jgi:hypothetical protein